jgi:hypothetical protein
MSVGKYSPTVSRWYAKDQDWWKKNGGGFGNGIDPKSYDDDEGYDSYGYSDNGDGEDRAGYSESDYGMDYDEDSDMYPTYERVSAEWWAGKQKYKNQVL